MQIAKKSRTCETIYAPCAMPDLRAATNNQKLDFQEETFQAPPPFHHTAVIDAGSVESLPRRTKLADQRSKNE
jgi:hypothetical protein